MKDQMIFNHQNGAARSRYARRKLRALAFLQSARGCLPNLPSTRVASRSNVETPEQFVLHRQDATGRVNFADVPETR